MGICVAMFAADARRCAAAEVLVAGSIERFAVDRASCVGMVDEAE